MKNIILITFIVISFIGFAQRDIMTVTRYKPKMENQVIKPDTTKDLEYEIVKEYQGVEIDTAFVNSEFRKLEKLQEKHMTPVEKPDGPNLEELYWLDLDDSKKINEEENKKEPIKKK